MTPRSITAALLREALSLEGHEDVFGPIDVSQARAAGVAVPISLGEEPRMHLVLRSRHLADHAGEIGFPGGTRDLEDVELRATAARELFEEVGVVEGDVEWLGTLSRCPVITGRYVIHPFVGVLREGVTPRVASGEVAEVLTLAILPYVTGAERVRAIEVEWRGVKVITPHFPVGGHVLYGATAYIAHELLERVAKVMGHALAPPEVETSAPWRERYRKL